MEYTGTNSGSVPFKVPGGRVYRGSRKTDRFADVLPEDADYLERTRRWKRVERPVAQVEANSKDPMSRPGVEFTDEQNKVIEKLVSAGDMEKARDAVLDGLAKEFDEQPKAVVLDASDGISDKEASAAGEALAQRKSQRKKAK